MRRRNGVPFRILARTIHNSIVVSQNQILINPNTSRILESIGTESLYSINSLQMGLSTTRTVLARSYIGVPMIFDSLSDDDGT